MNMRSKIQNKMVKQREEIFEMELNLHKAKAFMLGLEETFKMCPKDQKKDKTPGMVTMRPGSMVEKVRALLINYGRPLKINTILDEMGLGKEKRSSLTSQLGNYVNKGVIFTRPLPGVFGLVELEINDSIAASFTESVAEAFHSNGVSRFPVGIQPKGELQDDHDHASCPDEEDEEEDYLK